MTNQRLENSKPVSRRFSLDSGMDRLRAKFVAADCNNRMPFPRRLMDANGASSSNNIRQRRLAAWVEADLLMGGSSGGDNVEITGLELLMMLDDNFKPTEDDYDDDDSISMVSYEISCGSMDSIANDSIDLARQRQQSKASHGKRRSYSISSSSSSSLEQADMMSVVEGGSVTKRSNDSSASCSSKSVYSLLFVEQQMVQDFSETVTINTGGTNRAA